MPLQKLEFRPGINREGTSLANEGGYFECDKIRFRSGFPEKIGGWLANSYNTFLGACRSLWNWVTLLNFNLLGLGTNLKFYIEYGGSYYDITPIRYVSTSTATFSATPGSSVLTVTDANNGVKLGDFVTFSGATALSIQNVSISIASITNYAIINLASGLANGTPISLATTGTLPTGLVAGKTYYVINYSALTCNLSLTAGGSAVPILNATYTGTVTLSNTNGMSAAVLNQQYQVAAVPLNASTYIVNARAGGTTVENPGAAVVATVYDTKNGGSSISASYQINVGSATFFSGTGWGAGPWSRSTWGSGYSAGFADQIRLWSQTNYGENLIISPRGGALYIWQPGSGAVPAFGTPAQLINGEQLIAISVGSPAVVTLTTLLQLNTPVQLLTTGTLPTGLSTNTTYYVINPNGFTCNLSLTPTTAGATAINTTGAGTGFQLLQVLSIPSQTNLVLVSDATRIVICFGCNDYGPYGTTPQDPLLIRWSTNEDYLVWEPSVANQAGSYRLSHGSLIVTAIQTRQEILVWTDSAIYSMQYSGPPYVFNFNILADNISIIGPNAVNTANGITYWMGRDKFYVYSGRVETLPCALRSYVFDNLNKEQNFQFFAGTNEGYSEIWWFYCSITGPDGTGTRTNPNTKIDRYVIFNYLDRVWYYGTMNRTAWLESKIRSYPQATTYDSNTEQGILVNHEYGVDDGVTSPALPIYSYVQSSDYDIGDGHNYGFIWRIVPDITFDGSNVDQPYANFIVKPRKNPGSDYGSADSPSVTSAENYSNINSYNVQLFTQQVYTRVRGRQLAFRIESNSLGVQWQLGVPRIDVRPDGRRA
jgi:hypothetical protein